MADPKRIAPEEEQRRRVYWTLMSQPCQSIRFNYGSFHINNLSYYGVARRLAVPAPSKPIKFNIGSLAKANIGAGYDAPSNTFSLPSRTFGATDPREKMSIVHEGTHAALDLMFPQGVRIRELDSEIMAYLAAAMFNVYSGRKAELTGIYKVADSLAEPYCKQPGSSVSARDAAVACPSDSRLRSL